MNFFSSTTPSRTFSNTFMESKSAPFWKTYPIVFRSSDSSSRLSSGTSLPSTITWPESGVMSPMMVLSNTLLPVPEGPSSATVSPSRTSKSTPSRMTCEPKRFFTPRSSIMY